MGDTYTGSFYCTNCSWEGNLSVDKGTTLKDFADGTECPNCDCDTLHVS